MTELEPVELTEPLDVVAWLRALPVGAVLLDAEGDAWQVRSSWEHGAYFAVAGNDERYYARDDEQAANVAAWGPFSVLHLPQEGGT